MSEISCEILAQQVLSLNTSDDVPDVLYFLDYLFVVAIVLGSLQNYFFHNKKCAYKRYQNINVGIGWVRLIRTQLVRSST